MIRPFAPLSAGKKPMILVEVGGIEPHTRVVAQGLTPYCDQIVTVFFDSSRYLCWKSSGHQSLTSMINALDLNARYAFDGKLIDLLQPVPKIQDKSPYSFTFLTGKEK
ncbi:MAG: hypothetical protein KOO62_00660 [candidate division Zixibacteria bacterium]|nr:hypothetical protein [candidate division Zixibacteria bacterium]